MEEFERLLQTVFPSQEKSIAVKTDEEYNGAHLYSFRNCLGFNDGETKYSWNVQKIQFIQKHEDGSITEGLQSEQLLIALIDRHRKLNDRFPSREGALAITKMEEALHWMQARVSERVQRGVMGQLKK